MKILIITNLYKPYNRGGAERVVEQQVAHEREQGNDAMLLTACPWSISGLIPRKKDGIYHIYPLNLFFYPNDTKKHPLVRFFWHIIDTVNIHTFLATLYLIKKERPDAIHTHNLKGIGYLIPLAIRFSRVPWTHIVHDIQLITPSGLMLIGEERHWHHAGPLTRAYRIITRALFGPPETVMFLSNWCKKIYDTYGFFSKSQKIVRRLTADPIFSIPSPHSDIPAKDRVPSDEEKKRYANRIVYAGQMESHKGIMWLLAQATKNQQYEFHLYGKGSLLSYAQHIAGKQKHIHVHGAVHKEEIADALKKSRYFIYPSIAYENCPLAILEAQAAGCTIIAPAHSGIAELLRKDDIIINMDRDLDVK